LQSSSSCSGATDYKDSTDRRKKEEPERRAPEVIFPPKGPLFMSPPQRFRFLAEDAASSCNKVIVAR
jgi:hypothetical protein